MSENTISHNDNQKAGETPALQKAPTPKPLPKQTPEAPNAKDKSVLISGRHSRGYLPHLKKLNAAYFVTFRLNGTLPKHIIDKFKAEARLAAQQELISNKQQPENKEEIEEQKYINIVDDYLDTCQGECHLKHQKIAESVAGSLTFFDENRYHLQAWVVMPNHVHVVVSPMDEYSLSTILHSWKSYTAKSAIRILCTRLEHFWQAESFDRLIRNDSELLKYCDYTINNPVKAGLCKAPDEWAFSSASNRPKSLVK